MMHIIQNRHFVPLHPSGAMKMDSLAARPAACFSLWLHGATGPPCPWHLFLLFLTFWLFA